VTVVEFQDRALTTVDKEFGLAVGDELRAHGVELRTGVQVEAIERQDESLLIRGSGGFSAASDLVIVVVGVRPSTELAETARVSLGARGAVHVTRAMETGVPDIYAAGDCVETYHRVLGRDVYLPLGTTAHRQGRVAGENAVGGQALFAGSTGTQVVKVFDLIVARTGLLGSEASRHDYDPLTHELETWDHKVYYPGARRLRIRLTGDKSTGRMLGAQLLGHASSEVSKRIDVCATALFHAMTVDDLNLLDLSYTPPLSSPWDPIQMAAQAWVAAWRG
jgi:NADPH-dependent 2,4-dienoyl-CoA reductase/sulfur reductase-like enzyme